MPFNCYGEIILFSTKTTLRIERVSQNGECLKKIFGVNVSDVLVQNCPLGVFASFEFWMFENSYGLFLIFACWEIVS